MRHDFNACIHTFRKRFTFILKCLFSVTILRVEILGRTTLKFGTEIGLKLPYIYHKRYLHDIYH